MGINYMNKIYFLLFLSIFQLTPLFGMSSWLEKLQDKFFVCNNQKIIAEVKQMLDNGSSVKETFTTQILDRQNQAFKNCLYFVNQNSQQLPNNLHYSDTEIESKLQSCVSLDFNTHLDPNGVLHDPLIPKKILDYTKQRLAKRGINPNLINIVSFNEAVKNNLCDKDDSEIFVAIYRKTVLSDRKQYFIVLSQKISAMPFNLAKATIYHEVEHIAQHHGPLTMELIELEGKAFSGEESPSIKLLHKVFVDLKQSYFRERESTADQLPALESIENAAIMKHDRFNELKKCLFSSLRRLSKFDCGLAFFGAACTAIGVRIGNNNASASEYICPGFIMGCLSLGCQAVVDTIQRCLHTYDTHPPYWQRYCALKKIEKYLRAEEYLKKNAQRQKTT